MLNEYHKDSFTISVIVFVTINDYPTLFTLSGQFKGKVGYVVCIDGTTYVFLDASKKLVYMRHKYFLSKGHRYRLKKMDKYFDNNDELHFTALLGNNKGQRVFLNSQQNQIYFWKEDKRGKTKKGYETNSTGYIQEVYFLRVFVIL